MAQATADLARILVITIGAVRDAVFYVSWFCLIVRVCVCGVVCVSCCDALCVPCSLFMHAVSSTVHFQKSHGKKGRVICNNYLAPIVWISQLLW